MVKSARDRSSSRWTSDRSVALLVQYAHVHAPTGLGPGILVMTSFFMIDSGTVQVGRD
jgi:hypothetical protein